MATLGVIGSGNIGGALGRLAGDAGLDVVLSNSRGPRTLSDLGAELGPRARAGIPLQAAAAGDWVVVAIPYSAIGAVPSEPLVGKTVIDTGNYWAPRDGAIPELDAKELTDSELLRRHLAEAHVVKAFNNINYEHLPVLPRPVNAADRTTPADRRKRPGREEARRRVALAARVRLRGHGTAHRKLALTGRQSGLLRALCGDQGRPLPGPAGRPASAAEIRAALARHGADSRKPASLARRTVASAARAQERRPHPPSLARSDSAGHAPQ